LGEIAEQRRRELNVPVTKVLKSRETWLRVVAGKPVADSTYRNVEDSLQWERLSIDDVLAGGDARPVREPDADPEAQRWDRLAYITTTGELISGLAGNTPQEQAQVLELLELGRRRLEERRRRENNSQAT
jgi:hypothetical protein